MWEKSTGTGTFGPVEHHTADASGYTCSSSAYVILPQINDVQWHTQTHSQLKNRHYWIHGSVVKVCIFIRTPHCRTALQNGQEKLRKHLQISNLSWKTRQDFLKTPSLWGVALKIERRFFSKFKCHSHYNKDCGWNDINLFLSFLPPTETQRLGFNHWDIAVQEQCVV